MAWREALKITWDRIRRWGWANLRKALSMSRDRACIPMSIQLQQRPNLEIRKLITKIQSNEQKLIPWQSKTKYDQLMPSQANKSSRANTGIWSTRMSFLSLSQTIKAWIRCLLNHISKSKMSWNVNLTASEDHINHSNLHLSTRWRCSLKSLR